MTTDRTTSLCKDCVHYRSPKPRPKIQFGSAPGETDAMQRLTAREEQRRNEEQRRVEDNYQFDYEPLFFPWCQKFTPNTVVLKNITAALSKHSKNELEEYIEVIKNRHEIDFYIDLVKGTVNPVYALCLQKNPRGDCEQFERSKQ